MFGVYSTFSRCLFCASIFLKSVSKLNQQEIIAALQNASLDLADDISVSPLTGGVSSDIWLIADSEKTYVLKMALARLKVDALWEADVKRNIAEQEFIEFLSVISPSSVPKIYLQNREPPYFVMEYVGEPFENWKSQMLAGTFSVSSTVNAAKLLATIHKHSWGKAELKTKFDHMPSFFQLRIEPYLLATGKNHPALQTVFFNEARRLEQIQLCLVHGDFSPKNILVTDERLVLLDHEVACAADPAFDMAFFINHLMLKSLLFPQNPDAMDLPLIAWTTYFEHLGKYGKGELAERTSKLWLMLFLARVDGKSPVEYLEDRHKHFIRAFVHQHLTADGADDFQHLHQVFSNELVELQK